MAIGDYGNNNSNGNSRNNGVYEATCYSRYRFKNDNSSLTITYKMGLIVLEISEVDSSDGYKPVPKAKIYLSPIKAKMLVEQIGAFLEYKTSKKIDPNKAFGVNAGMAEKVSYIGFSTDDELHNIITIGKFDGNGTITESATFTFAKDYNYSLEWNNIKSNDLSKVFHNEVELDMLRTALIDFSRAMSGAYAYANIDTARYENARDHYRIDSILDKLGIERRSSGNGNSYSGGSNNYLSNASSSSKSTSIDDIEDLLG